MLVCSAVALAAVRTCTNGNDRLAGTGDNDRITGRGDDDTTIGKAGNDSYYYYYYCYYYANSWGQDTVIDSSAGTDTLNFSAVTGNVDAFACPGLVGTVDSVSGGVELKAQFEGSKGGLGNDRLNGCGAKNTHAGGARQPLGTGHDPGEPAAGLRRDAGHWAPRQRRRVPSLP